MFVAARKSEVETETEIFNVAPLPAGLDTARIQTPVVISIHLNNDGWVECNFTDNGNGMATGDRHPGLGSSIFDSLAWGNWSLKPGPGGIGTCLHMIIPALELPPARGGSSVG